MSIKAAWIPKSERGREIARFLRAEGFALRDKDVQGHYLCNVVGDELTTEQLREIAWLLNPEHACYDEEAAYREAARLRDNAARLGLAPGEAEQAAERAETAWLY